MIYLCDILTQLTPEGSEKLLTIRRTDPDWYPSRQGRGGNEGCLGRGGSLAIGHVQCEKILRFDNARIRLFPGINQGICARTME